MSKHSFAHRVLMLGFATLAALPALAVNLFVNHGTVHFHGHALGNEFTQLVMSQCIAAGPGNYLFGGKIQRNVPLVASGEIVASYFSGPDCTTGAIGFHTLSHGPYESISVPTGTTHILISAFVHQFALPDFLAGIRYDVDFDDFLLDDGVSTDVPALSPIGLLAVVIAAMAIGLFALRR